MPGQSDEGQETGPGLQEDESSLAGTLEASRKILGI